MLRLRIYTRYGPKSSRYFDFCREYTQELEELQPEAIEMWTDESWKRICSDKALLRKAMLCVYKSEELLIKSVIFAHMCLEAFIYDYAAHYFSDAYAKKHLDKLDFPSKWVLIPKLIMGRDFPKESKAFEYLIKLNRYRNEFIHPKSKALIDLEKNGIKFVKKIGPSMKKDAYLWAYIAHNPPFQMIMEVLAELRRLEGDDIATQWWQLDEITDWWEEE
jgi:hypothetical protein